MEVKLELTPTECSFIYLNIWFLFMCICVCAFTHVCRCPQKPGEAVGSPEGGVTGGYESPGVGAGN